MRIEQVISLGCDCQIGHQVRRCFGVEMNGIFDWLVTPIDSLIPVLKEAGERYGESWSLFGRALQCMTYGTVHHHDFMETPDHRIIIQTDSLQDTQDKLRHKAESTVKACQSSRPTLFVRRRASADTADDRFKTSPITSADLNDLVAGLEALFPILPFKLLFIQVPDRSDEIYHFSDPLSEKIILYTMPSSGGWTGDDGTYNAMFDSLGLTYTARAPTAA